MNEDFNDFNDFDDGSYANFANEINYRYRLLNEIDVLDDKTYLYFDEIEEQ